ncbi:hypothetical protein BH10BAC4_BH10BAC4_23370 [soil metagenome]
MKSIITNSIIEWIKGKMSKTVHGEEICLISQPLKRKGPLSEQQKRQQSRFQQASDYAKRQMLDPKMRALYETGTTQKMKSAYVVALTDALTAPHVRNIDTSHYHGFAGDAIVIHAWDDFKVNSVDVMIADSKGYHVESGEAVADKHNPMKWIYTARVRNRLVPGVEIAATAYDYADNQDSLIVALEESDCKPAPQGTRSNHEITRS